MFEMGILKIYVDNVRGTDRFDNFEDGSPRTTAGTRGDPVATADRAFALLPPTWSGGAQIIFAATGRDYPIRSSSVSFGQPVGMGTPLVIRGDYYDEFVYAAADGGGHEITITDRVPADRFLGAVLTRISLNDGAPFDDAVAIRGNTDEPNSRILLHGDFGRITRHQKLAVQRPAVRLVPAETLNFTSQDMRSPNLTFVGVEIAPAPGSGLNFLNVRAQFDTCALSLRRGSSRAPVTCNVHTNSHLIGGIENAGLSPGLRMFPGQNLRQKAGLYVNSSDQSDIIWATTGSALSRHLSFRRITVRSSLGGRFSPTTLEACEAPIRIMAEGLALSLGINGWGTADNKGRIRNVVDNSVTDPGDGLRITNGGSIQSTGAPLHLDVYGCARDGIHLDSGAVGYFAPEDGDAGLVTTGTPNWRFGMNVRNGSRAFVGADATLARVTGAPEPTPLKGGHLEMGEIIGGEVALDDVLVRDPDGDPSGWRAVLDGPRSNSRFSLVCQYT